MRVRGIGADLEVSKKARSEIDTIKYYTSPKTLYGKVTRKHHKQESKEVSPFPAGDHKAARNRQDSMTDMKDN